MNKRLARYFVKLISEDLQFSFNGMGIPSYGCEWLENQIMKENFDEVEEFIKKRYYERENTRKKARIKEDKVCSFLGLDGFSAKMITKDEYEQNTDDET